MNHPEFARRAQGVTIKMVDPATERAAALCVDEIPDFDHRRMVTDTLPDCTPCRETLPRVLATARGLGTKLVPDYDRLTVEPRQSSLRRFCEYQADLR